MTYHDQYMSWDDPVEDARLAKIAHDKIVEDKRSIEMNVLAKKIAADPGDYIAIDVYNVEVDPKKEAFNIVVSFRFSNTYPGGKLLKNNIINSNNYERLLQFDLEDNHSFIFCTSKVTFGRKRNQWLWEDIVMIGNKDEVGSISRPIYNNWKRNNHAQD